VQRQRAACSFQRQIVLARSLGRRTVKVEQASLSLAATLGMKRGVLANARNRSQ